MAFDSFGNGGGKAWQTPAPAEKPESAAAAGHSLAPTMRVGGGPTDGCSSGIAAKSKSQAYTTSTYKIRPIASKTEPNSEYILVVRRDQIF